MPLPFITVGLSLAAAGLRIFGHEKKLLEFVAHPLDVAAGHLGAENILEVAGRFREWYAGNERFENQDLEKAVMRSVFLADLFCLLDALPLQSSDTGPTSKLWERLKTWLPGESLKGIVSQAHEAAIRPALKACQKRLKELEEGTFVPAQIDPYRLVLPELGKDWGAKLAHEALADIERQHANLPEKLRNIYQERWFAYLCLAFHEQIKANARVSAIFHTMQVATGFVRIEDVIREEHAKTRRLITQVGPHPTITPGYPGGSVRAPSFNYEGVILSTPAETTDLGAWSSYAKTLLEFYDAPPSPAYAYARVPEAISIRCTLDGAVSMDLIPLLIRRFAGETRAKPVILLGEYGQGKTAACGSLAANLAHEFLSNTSTKPIPLIVPLCDLRDLDSLDDYIQSRLSNWYGITADVLSFTKVRAARRFVIILDGLDEYLANHSKADVVFHLRQFALHTTLRQNQFLIASRPNVFGPRDRGDLTPLYDLVDTEWLAAADIHAYLGRLGLQDVMDDPRAMPMLRQIAIRPLFLTMLSQAVETLGARHVATNQAAFLEYYVDAWYEREEREKGHERGALTKDEVLSVLEHVAASMNVRNSDTITERELSLLVEDSLRPYWRLELDRLHTQARDRLLLVPDFRVKGRQLTFRHAYYRSYFSAKHLERAIVQRDFDSVRSARVEDLTTDMLFQLADGNEELSRALHDEAKKLAEMSDWTVDTWAVTLSMWAIRSGVPVPSYRLRDLFKFLGKGAGRIVFNLMSSLGLAQLEDLEISNMDLNGAVVQKLVLKACSLSAVNMRASSIPGATLDHCILDSCDVRHAWLVNASIVHGTLRAKSDFSFANMSRCTLSDTCINDCSFVRTRLPEISATGVTFNNCDFTSADFRLSRLQSCTFSRCRLNGALFLGSLLTSCRFPESDIDLAFGLREAM